MNRYPEVHPGSRTSVHPCSRASVHSDRRPPAFRRSILGTTSGPNANVVAKLAEIADRVYEIAPMTPQVASTSSSASAASTDLAAQVSELTKQVAALTAQMNSRGRHRSHSRSSANRQRTQKTDPLTALINKERVIDSNYTWKVIDSFKLVSLVKFINS
ncbi:hypothetical protein HW555_014056 [Spodoptera exigua]|uniref:Uncharacterized protein n=1 Tax=Spodoptera exigua TaxID=7107 RepID=A0A835G2Z6_SPOEX|nr:hypothetical protein HW555_014056 [Spodoptera exigua]